MGDADDSYDFTAIAPLVEKLREGYDLVMGNRFPGGIEPGAMPWSHRWVGNPVLSLIGRVFFHSPGRRLPLRLARLPQGRLRADGAAHDRDGVRQRDGHQGVAEGHDASPRCRSTLPPDGRSRPPHLRTWRDGWRHLRFMLLFSPRWLFLYPGPGPVRGRDPALGPTGRPAARRGRSPRHPHHAGRRLSRPAGLSARPVRALHQDLRRSGRAFIRRTRPRAVSRYVTLEVGRRRAR